MFRYTIIRTDRLDNLLATERHFDGTVERFRNQVNNQRDALNDANASKIALENKLTQALIDLSAANQELENWRAHGQLRDPKTGRLIAKAKAA